MVLVDGATSPHCPDHVTGAIFYSCVRQVSCRIDRLNRFYKTRKLWRCVFLFCKNCFNTVRVLCIKKKKEKQKCDYTVIIVYKEMSIPKQRFYS